MTNDDEIFLSPLTRSSLYKQQCIQIQYCTCDWEDVTVADGGHGDDDPVEGGGDGGEARVLVLLYEIGEAAEDEAGDADEEDKETQLLVAVLERVRDRLD